MAEDSEMAFKLQPEDAIAAILEGGGVPPPNTTPYDATIVCEQEFLEDVMAEVEAERLRLDLIRQVHDRALACEIMSVPDEEWLKTGNNLQRPFGEGSSSSSSSWNGQNFEFRVYVKGLVEGEAGGIGAAICDGSDGLLYELSEGFSGKDQESDEELIDFKALIEGLDAAAILDLKRIVIVTDNPLLYQHITGENTETIKRDVALSNQLHLLLRRFTGTRASLVASNDNKSVKLAMNAIALQVNSSVGSSNTKNQTECCTICMEVTYVDQMFLITNCRHSYCFLCMLKHVQFKLLQGMLPNCPHENCKTELQLESCEAFLTPELLEIMSERMKEASIPAEDKFYCPYPRCSALSSKTELRGFSFADPVDAIYKARKCPKCGGIFCIDCKVPWHNNMGCSEFKRRDPEPCKEDKLLKSLASRNLWRQCPKCNHMVSLASGCYHIYCRCGHEFCYTCGAEWRNKKATCKCAIWDERNLIYEQNRQHERNLINEQNRQHERNLINEQNRQHERNLINEQNRQHELNLIYEQNRQHEQHERNLINEQNRQHERNLINEQNRQHELNLIYEQNRQHERNLINEQNRRQQKHKIQLCFSRACGFLALLFSSFGILLCISLFFFALLR